MADPAGYSYLIALRHEGLNLEVLAHLFCVK